MSASWHPAPSLRALFAEVNRHAPRRNKRTDGTIGDKNHKPPSDHIPDKDAGGVVRAADVTHDPAGGLDCNRLAKTIQDRRDPRVAYIIFSRQIMSGDSGRKPWRWRAYTGDSPHTEHLHISIKHTTAAETDQGSWLGGPPLSFVPGSVNPVKGWDEMATKEQIKDAVREVLREELKVVIQGDPNTDDGGAHPHNLRNINRAVEAIKKKVED